jgi:hypothetical protein
MDKQRKQIMVSGALLSSPCSTRKPARWVPAILLALFLPLAPVSAFAVPVQWEVGSGGNGHFYEVISFTSPITWDAARADALGRSGDLASIASAAENDFVFTLIDSPAYWSSSGPHNYGPWIGGFQDDFSSEPSGGWDWTDGTAWGFTAWASGQPDNFGAAEHNAHYFVPANARGSTWNDWTGPGQLVNSYVWEAVPEPSVSTMLLVGLLVGAACRTGRRSNPA